jgi:short-subunit dehydrogenase
MSPKPWVLITGATSGIGLASAVYLAINGYRVIATGRSEEKLAVVAKAAEEAGVTIRRATVDVTDAHSIEELKSEVLALTGGYGVDVLVNNAGYAEGGAIEDIPIERLRQQFETNVFGLVAVSQAFIPFMRARKQGRIINISSVVGKVSIPLMGPYTSTKYAVESISDVMRLELSDAGIQVVIVAPGSIQTNFGSTLIGNVKDWVPEDSPYQSAYKKFTKDRSKAHSGAKPMVIAQTILRAIQSSHPKHRYAVPYDSKLMPILKAILPARTLDKVIRKAVMGKS